MKQEKSKLRQGQGALDAFLNLLSLITLGWLAGAIGAIIFQLINRYFGGVGYSSAYFSEPAVKYGIASIIVIAPVYYAALNVLHNRYKRGELNHAGGIYRWLTYLMLLVSALTIIGSLIALISGFLNGDYTVNTLLKILTVAVIAGFIFGYYLFDLRRRDYSKINRWSLIVGVVVAVLLAAAVIVGFMNVETPQTARLRLADSRAQQALTALSYSISSAYAASGELDENIDLADFVTPSREYDLTGIAYRKVSAKDFQLCVNFNLDVAATNDSAYIDPMYPWARYQRGYQCYTINAASEMEKYNKAAIPDIQAEINKGPNPPAPAGQPIN